MSTRLIDEGEEQNRIKSSHGDASNKLLLLLRHYHPKADAPGFYDVNLKQEQPRGRT